MFQEETSAIVDADEEELADKLGADSAYESSNASVQDTSDEENMSEVKILNKTFWMISSSTTDLPPNGNSMMDFSTSSYSTTDLWMRKFDSGSFSQSGLPPRVYLDLQLTSF